MASSIQDLPSSKRVRSPVKPKLQAEANRTPPHAVDVHVGTAVRRLRKAKGLTQIELAGAIGLTFQQIQKYERGTNRISASKLLDIGVFLGVPVAYFFSDLPGQAIVDLGLVTSSPIEKGPDEVVALAYRIGELPRRRRKLVGQLIDELASDDPKSDAGA